MTRRRYLFSVVSVRSTNFSNATANGDENGAVYINSLYTLIYYTQLYTLTDFDRIRWSAFSS